ncbi:MAG: DUF302 domain-containing protein [Armatimonadota bacterium]
MGADSGGYYFHAMDKECDEVIEIAEGPSICVESHAAAVLRESGYGVKVWIDRPHEAVLDSARRALSLEGIDVLWETDVRGLLGEAGPRHIILGVSRADWMRRALDLDRDIGLLLPFNFAVYEEGAGTVVEAVDPISLLAVADGDDLRELARTVKQKLMDAVDHVAAGLE